MTNRTIAGLQAALRKADHEQRTGDQDDLVPIAFDLYPIEVLDAAKAELGEEGLATYAYELYVFGIQAQTVSANVRTKQLHALLMTQKKLDKWLRSKHIHDVFNLGDKAVLRIFLDHHIAQVEESLSLLKLISREVTKGSVQL